MSAIMPLKSYQSFRHCRASDAMISAADISPADDAATPDYFSMSATSLRHHYYALFSDDC